jgi:hypothetical protein
MRRPHATDELQDVEHLLHADSPVVIDVAAPENGLASKSTKEKGITLTQKGYGRKWVKRALLELGTGA